jgi:protein TonB
MIRREPVVLGPRDEALPTVALRAGALRAGALRAGALPIRTPPDETAPNAPASRVWTLPNRGMIVTLSVSLGLHAAAVVAVLLLLHAAVPVADTPDKPTEVELVMEERKGDLSPTASPPPSPPAPDATRPERERSAPQEAQAAAPPPVEAQPNTSDAAAATVEARRDAPEETAAPATQSQPAAAAAQAPVQEAKPEPAPPSAQEVPTISLAGTDSPSNARAFGAHIIPAAPSAVFHNRPPVYPQEAAQSGEHGTVVVVVHVSPAGTAASVDLLRSSGYALLDRAATDAVLRWRFLPAVKDGQPVASDMTMGFEFDNE